MGSLFSRSSEDPQDPLNVAALPGAKRLEHNEQNLKPLKRRRIEERNAIISKTVPPLTRAMESSHHHMKHPAAFPCPDAINSLLSVPKSQPDSENYLDTFSHGADKKRVRKRKYAVFLGYNGEKFYGMQINPGVVTIEGVLLTAFYRAELISDDNKDSLSKINWMRSARTDKGVSAVVQCVSVKLEVLPENIHDSSLISTINHHLPADIQVYGVLRTTGGFNARSDCHRRRYEYVFPVRLLGGINGVENEKIPGEGDPRSAKLTTILKRFEGTHCFANFTDGLAASEDASRRYMINLTCGQPFKPPNSGVYFVAVKIYGQSFLLHQIRKMVGLSLYVFLGCTPEESISVALCPHVKLHTPMAPAVGLLLDDLIFDNYNRRFKSNLERPISSEAFKEEKTSFKINHVYSRIAEKERKERALETWVRNRHDGFRYKRSEILELHQKFIETGIGREEQRKAYISSLYPVVTSEKEFLDSESEGIASLAQNLRQQFEQVYGCPPTFLARVPGRINVIGEHLDYNGLPVIGMALRQGSMAAGCLDNTDVIEIKHMETNIYNGGKLRSDGHRMVEEGENPELSSSWIQYVSWGVKALFQSLEKSKRTVSGGGRLLFGGDLPLGAGLASSSSLVTLSALATARLNRHKLPRQEIALRAAEGEREGAGTRGGSVDHALGMCAVKGSALLVSFTPRISSKCLPLLSKASYIAVGSNVNAHKDFDDNIKEQFNLRAAECRIAAAILARRLQVFSYRSVTTPGQLLFQAKKTSNMQCRTISSLREKAQVVMNVSEVASLEKIKEELGISEIELRNRFLLGVNIHSLSVGKRMAHVFSEAERVEKYSELLAAEEVDEETKLIGLGKILSEGHESLRENYESSCTEVDELVKFCLTNGALGSRVTGAEWGGFTINLVPMEKKMKFLAAVRKKVGVGSVIEVEGSSGARIFAIHNVLGGSDRRN